MFLLTDTQIKEESFLEDVDGLLNAGEVPNLFELDEKQEILEVSVQLSHMSLKPCNMHVTCCRLCVPWHRLRTKMLSTLHSHSSTFL